MRRWWREIAGAIVAIVVIFLAAPGLIDGPTVGGQELSDFAGEVGGGFQRMATDTIVRVAEIVVVVLLASVAGGLVTGLLSGRFVTRVRAGSMETGIVGAADEIQSAQTDLWEAIGALRAEVEQLAESVGYPVEPEGGEEAGQSDDEGRESL